MLGFPDTPMLKYTAIKTGLVEALKVLLIVADDENSDAYLLTRAAEFDQCAVMVLLLESGNDINFMFANQTALHVAAAAGNTDAMSLLLDNGADLECYAATKEAHTVLFRAVAAGQIKVIELLLESGVDVDAYALNHGQTALHAAAANGDYSTIAREC